MAFPGGYWSHNLGGSLALLEAMRETGVRRIVFSSTAAVYGEPERTPIEETDPTRPTSPYGASKLAVDTSLTEFARMFGLGAVSLRYFNVAGAHEDCGGQCVREQHSPETHLIPNVLKMALPGPRGAAAVKIYGDDYPTPDGTCVRDYIHVADLAVAHLLSLDACEPGEHQIYNLGNGTGFSVREVIDVCREVTGVDIPAEAAPRRGGDPAVLVASSLRISSQPARTPRATSGPWWPTPGRLRRRSRRGKRQAADDVRPGGQGGGGRRSIAAQAADWFRACYGDAPQGVWLAPGRVNLVGEHTDYNDGFVLPFALGQGVAAAAASRNDDVLALRTRRDPSATVGIPLDLLRPRPGGEPRAESVRDGIPGWARYPAGVAWSLVAAGNPVRGVSVAIDSCLADEAGLSSSAALECSVALALTELGGAGDPAVSRRELAAIARRAENEFAGVPSGIMGQSASLLCEAGHALLLDCQSLEASQVPFDPAVAGTASW